MRAKSRSEPHMNLRCTKTRVLEGVTASATSSDLTDLDEHRPRPSGHPASRSVDNPRPARLKRTSRRLDDGSPQDETGLPPKGGTRGRTRRRRREQAPTVQPQPLTCTQSPQSRSGCSPGSANSTEPSSTWSRACWPTSRPNPHEDPGRRPACARPHRGRVIDPTWLHFHAIGCVQVIGTVRGVAPASSRAHTLP
jgi:hypothetical protein